MAVAVVFVAFFATVFGVFYLYLNTRNRERMGLIEKGADASLFNGNRQPLVRQKNSQFRFSLKAGTFIVGTGLGFVISYILYQLMSSGQGTSEYHPDDEMFALLTVGIVFICGGLGLVIGYYMGRSLDKADYKE
ncbi:MAG: hypothetical protein A2X22_07820 [Bacteroidetes bacterium GWF2_49_14]|nr:MAG: hypothetical protein A2X22_07820 [Bacteroidetes bacterium GWF2_49_14]HBB90780.1 hypothetical protein [Bacteroidales bacterium]